MTEEANVLTETPTVTATPAEVPQEPAQVTSDAQPQESTPAEPSDGARPNRAQERIEELNARTKAAIEYGEFYRQRFEELAKTQQQPAAAAPVVTSDPEPTLEQFDHDAAAYAKALSAWNRRQVTEEFKRIATETARAEREKAVEEAELRSLGESFQSKAEAFAEKNPDFWVTVKNPALGFINGQFFKALQSSDKGPELAYHIAKDAKLVARLMSQSIPQRLMTLGRIEAEISRPPPPPKVTAAPAPPTPIGSGPAVQPDLADIKDIDTWMERRTKELLDRRKRG